MVTAQLLSQGPTSQLHTPDETGDGLPIVTLSAAASRALARRLATVPVSPYDDIEACLVQLSRIAPHLPPDLLQAVTQFRRAPQARGALVISNLPTDPTLPSTPHDGKRPRGKATFIGELGALVIAQLLGEVFSFQDEKAGELVQTVAPVQRNAATVSNEGSRVDLLLHTEDVHLYPFHPDFVLLHCLRADPLREAVTLVVDIRDALARLSPDIITTLRQPLYVVPPPASFGGQGTASAPMPVLRGPWTMPAVTVEFNVMTATTSQAESALTALKAACYSPAVLKQVYAAPGDLLILNNHKAIHGRNTFQPRFDGLDRWLLRLFVKVDLFWPSRGYCTASRRVLACSSPPSEEVAQ